MKIIHLLSIWAIGTGNIINGLMGNSAQTAVLSAAEKFLKGKKSSTSNSAPMPIAPSTSVASQKPSKMSKLIDLGTNAAMAIAGAGTLYSALSDVGKPPVEVYKL